MFSNKFFNQISFIFKHIVNFKYKLTSGSKIKVVDKGSKTKTKNIYTREIKLTATPKLVLKPRIHPIGRPMR